MDVPKLDTKRSSEMIEIIFFKEIQPKIKLQVTRLNKSIEFIIAPFRIMRAHTQREREKNLGICNGKRLTVVIDPHLPRQKL